MNIPYRRCLFGGPKIPLTWHRTTRDGMPLIYLVCECGHRGSLELHTIFPTGLVFPSVVCSTDCGFHESGLVLEAYSEEGIPILLN